jgi:non-ribosomal peptide synthetase component F
VGERAAGRAHGDKLAAYWRRVLTDLPEPLELADRRRPREVVGSDGEVLTRVLPVDCANRLDPLARRHGASMFMTVAAGLAAWAHALTGRDDFVLGFPHGGRQLGGLESVVGPLVNPLPLRCRIRPHDSFSTLFARTRVTSLGAYAHALYPFDRIVADAAPPRSRDRNPLFEIGLTWAADERHAGGGHPGLEAFSTVAKQDLWFHVSRAGGLRFDVEYRTGLFERATVESLVDQLLRILFAAADDPDARLTEAHRAPVGHTVPRHEP